ncbi:MAG: hypothetical protein AABX82_01345, partial [Nanoarchaeota archaeon]
TIVEVLSDDKGMVWPEAVAPYMVHLVPVVSDSEVIKYADSLYEDFKFAERNGECDKSRP